MALPLPSGLTPAEIGFLCEMELVTVIPRQRLDAIELMGGTTQALIPPFPTPLPLWLALLLKKQQRANIQPPSWLNPDALTQILDLETREETSQVFAPPPELPAATTVTEENEDYMSHRTLEMSVPFLANTSTSRAQADALPYHWLEMSHLLLANASDDFDDPEAVRRLVRDLREVRISKLRRGFRVLGPGGGLKMNGVGGMEIAEVRAFVGSVVDGLRKIGKSREEARREREEEERENGRYATGRYQDDDDDMQL